MVPQWGEGFLRLPQPVTLGVKDL